MKGPITATEVERRLVSEECRERCEAVNKSAVKLAEALLAPIARRLEYLLLGKTD